MISARRPGPALRVIVLAVLLVGCSSAEKDWNIAQRDDTPEAYLEFLAKHPDSEYVELAKQSVAEVKVKRAWERAEFRDSEIGYRDFTDRFPDSEQAALAQARLDEIERDVVWAAARKADSAEVLAAFIRDYPDAPQREDAEILLASMVSQEPAAAPAEPPGDYRVQLGAFRTPEAAESELRRLADLFPDTIGGPIRLEAPVPGGTTRLFKLKTVPMDLAGARNVCATLKSYGQTCLVIER